MLKKLIQDVAVYGVGDFASKLVAFAVFPLYTHALTVDEFGIFALVTTLGFLIGAVFNCGMNNAVQRYYMDLKTNEEKQSVVVSTGFACLLIFGLVVSAIFLFLLYPFRQFLETQNQITWKMITLGVTSVLLLQLNIFCLDVIRLHFKPWKFACLNLLQNIGMAALTLFFVLKMHWGVEGYLLGMVVAYALLLPLSLGMIRSNLTFRLEWQIAKKLILFGYPFIFAGIAFWIFGSTDRWMLGELGNNTQVGLYSVAFKIASVLIFINTALNQAWSPFAFRAQRTQPEYKSMFSRLAILWFFFSIVLALLMSLFSQELLLFFTPPDYWQAAEVLPYIVFGLALVGAGQIYGIGITIKEKTVHFTFAAWLTAGLNLILNYFLIPSSGAKGAAFATLISNLILFIYYFKCSQRFHPLPVDSKKFALCFILLFTSLVFQHWVFQHPWSVSVVYYKAAFVGVVLLVGFSQILSVGDFLSFFKRPQLQKEGAS